MSFLAEPAYISVFPEGRTSAVVDYLEMFNLTFTYVASEAPQLFMNGREVEVQPIINNQILIFPIEARRSTMGEYILWRNIEARK